MFLDDKKMIGRKIKIYRKMREMTQSELSEKADISEKHLSKIETGIHYPSIAVFFKIREILDIPLNEFGININSSCENQQRDELLKYIFSLNDIETSYLLNFAKNTFEHFNLTNK